MTDPDIRPQQRAVAERILVAHGILGGDAVDLAEDIVHALAEVERHAGEVGRCQLQGHQLDVVCLDGTGDPEAVVCVVCDRSWLIAR